MELYMKTSNNILIIGCGTSRMAEELLESGYSKIVQIDWSYSAIQLCEKINKEEGNTVIVSKVMDARRLQFKDECFDVVIDKGLLDAMTCGESAKANIQQMLSEAHRVLKPNGTY